MHFVGQETVAGLCG